MQTADLRARSRLVIVPLTWRQARAFVNRFHRHLGGPRGCKWAIGVTDEQGELRGVALCGRPTARALDDGLTFEVNRTCTDGCPNANSCLYAACWRIGAAMGYRRPSEERLAWAHPDETDALVLLALLRALEACRGT